MPDEDEIKDQKDNKLFHELVDREIETMDIFLTSKASRTAITLEEYVQARVAQGASKEAIRQYLQDDLTNGGRIFGEFRNAVRATSNGIVNRLRDNAVYAESGVSEQYRWVAVLVNTCPDCLERHGQIKTWEQWESDGLPRTGQTVCKEHCRCFLLPAENTEVEPIMRGK